MNRGLAFFGIRFSGNLTIMNAHTDGLRDEMRDDTRLEMINA